MSTAVQLLTADDLWNMPDRGGHRELVKGELRDMSPAGFDHGQVTLNLAIPLGTFIKANQLGAIVAAETGFIIERDPDTVRAPDIAFVRKDRLPKAERQLRFWPGAPDLAVETVSPWDTVFEIDEKVADWLTAGTPLVWVVNPKSKTVAVYRPQTPVRILTPGETLDGAEIVPGFQIPVADIFE